MIKKEIFHINDGFGYRIYDIEKNISIEQPFMPNVEGFQPMTQVEAEQEAEKVIQEINIITQQQII